LLLSARPEPLPSRFLFAPAAGHPGPAAGSRCRPSWLKGAIAATDDAGMSPQEASYQHPANPMAGGEELAGRQQDLLGKGANIGAHTAGRETVCDDPRNDL